MEKTQFFVLAHNIRSLHNVGSVFRTSDAFGVSKLYLSGYSGHPSVGPVVSSEGNKISKVALGAEKTVPWEYRKSPAIVVRALRKQYPSLIVVGLENNLPRGKKAVLLPQFKPAGPLLLVLGEEVDGIAKNVLALCNEFIEIPQYGVKESLNVSVAFGVAAYAIRTALS